MQDLVTKPFEEAKDKERRENGKKRLQGQRWPKRGRGTVGDMQNLSSSLIRFVELCSAV